LELFIVRHGQTDWTLSGQHTGVTDLPLTGEGKREAERLAPILARLLRGRTPAVYSSPRDRAISTARLGLPNADVEVDPLLSEYDYGKYEGLTLEQIHARAPDWDIWTDGCPDGETTAAVAARADEFLATRVLSAPVPVIAVTHGHLSRVLAARALNRAPLDASMFALSTASVSVVKDDEAGRCLHLWNLTAAAASGDYG
jgi:broad specificity phosphatase PhoE